MVVQVVPQSDPFASVGQAAGEGISEGLQMLINQKVEGMKRERLQESLKKMGLSPGLADIDPRIAAQVVKQKMAEKGMKDLFRLLYDEPPPITEEQPPEITEGEQVPPLEGTPPVEEVPPTEGIPPVEKQAPKGLGKLSDEKLILLQGQRGNVGEIAKAELLRRSQAEKVSGRKEESRYKSNLPLYQAAQKKLQSGEIENVSIKRLQTLNEGGNLPKGIKRWNVKFKDGELRIPFLAHPDAQAFVKTINDFTVKAKDSFGARVTNFELERFMKRLPGLLNSEEGRRVILRQMEIIGELNIMKDREIIDVFESKGGLRNIDYDRATTIANKKIKPQIEKLRKEYIQLNSRKLTEEAEKKKAPKKTTSQGVLMRDTQGRLRRVKKDDVKAAKASNYTLE